MNENPIVVKPSQPSPAVKPGWQTTELWATVLGIVLTALVMVGYMTTQQATDLREPMLELIGAVMSVLANVVLIWKYIASRQAVKLEAMRAKE